MQERAEPVPTATRRSFSQRIVAALKLRADLYEEIEHDPEALSQAVAVVALAAVAGGVASSTSFGLVGIFGALVASFFAWLLWTAIVWFVGVKLFDHSSDFQELLRTLGFVSAPQLLYVFAVIPIDAWQGLVGLTVLVMTFIAFVRATRQALDVETARALLVAAIGVVVYLGLGLLLGGLVRGV